jgi:hypothetical protein
MKKNTTTRAKRGGVKRRRLEPVIVEDKLEAMQPVVTQPAAVDRHRKQQQPRPRSVPLAWADPPTYLYSMENGIEAAKASTSVPPPRKVVTTMILGTDLLLTRGEKEVSSGSTNGTVSAVAPVIERIQIVDRESGGRLGDTAVRPSIVNQLEGTDWKFFSGCDSAQDHRNVRCSWLLDAMLMSESLPSPCPPPKTTAFSLMSNGFLQRLLSA